ncbi:protein bark beetle isoform X2 [Bacillus rossius redtenbacheri]|uniref:protein bark beetle isoform X2 n=1 Tax=Bacillus rossius redtenbacheri TaxID=93214 RepID=UPI002FDE384D
MRTCLLLCLWWLMAAGAARGQADPTEVAGGVIAGRAMTLTRAHSPYLVREDLVVAPTGELVLEAGVELRFAAMVGLTVRGVLTARGTADARILLTAGSEPPALPQLPEARLVDGQSVLSGRLQVRHRGRWLSVCSNSRNWTRADMEVLCRQLGYQGGGWLGWFDRQPGFRPRLLLEQPGCRGTETSLAECAWASRQVGAGVCDYHPDIGVQCAPRHVTSSGVVHHWRGVRFEHALADRVLTNQNTQYVLTSRSELSHVDIRYAGSGRNYNTSASLHVEGVPPRVGSLSVTRGAHTGISVTRPGAPLVLRNCTLRNNRGHGLHVNSSTGMVLLEGCLVTENGGDGVRYVRHDPDLTRGVDRSAMYDFCTLPTTAGQTFPVEFTVEQSARNPSEKTCTKQFHTVPGTTLTLQFVQLLAQRNDSALIQVFDGLGPGDRLLASLRLRNGSKPQSVATTGRTVYITFRAEPRAEVLAFLLLSVGPGKTYDLNVSESTVADNNGRGIAVENMRSQLHVHQSSVSNNHHVAGVHVLGGAGDVNVSDSRVAFNVGDGVNVSYVGGNRNITRSWLSSNKGYGLAVWLNDSVDSPHLAFNQTTVVSYSEIFKNEDVGVFLGNHSGESFVNISGNWFNDSLYSAVEIESAWRVRSSLLKLQIGHNFFIQNHRHAIKISPAINVDGRIEYNYFTKHTYGCILVKNKLMEEFNVFPARFLVQYNEFEFNQGVYVVNLGLSPYSEVQHLLFTRNFVRDNRIKEPFSFSDRTDLNPRGRVAAPVVVSSSNVDIFRNILQNPESNYEVGSHLEDQSKVINCTYNWLGFSTEEKIFFRLFHRKDRYNLARIQYLPFLLHSSNPGDTRVVATPLYVPQFHAAGSGVVGGEVDGVETLRAGEYTVERDINVRPGGRLTIQPGVTLRFPPSIGMMVAGKLDARGSGPNDIRLTLEDARVDTPQNDTEPAAEESSAPVRLLGGRTSREGRLQVRVGATWGTVCNYGWSITAAALVCHQLGLVLDPDDWFLQRAEIPDAGTNEPVLLSNVRCSEEDVDITRCRAETADDLENSCGHESDVGLRCQEPSWAGVRLGVLAEPARLQYVTVERAGLFDYSTNAFKPALQVDLSRHVLESVRLVNNLQDGLGVLYSDMYSTRDVNLARNCDFSNNRGSGISFKQLGMRVSGSSLENNKMAGVRHNPALTGQQQRELAGWFTPPADAAGSPYAPYSPLLLPSTFTNIELGEGETKHLVTQRVGPDAVDRRFYVRCTPGQVVGIQLLNPISAGSSESIVIYDGLSVADGTPSWDLSRDLVVFPTVTVSYGLVMDYASGTNALGGAVVILSSVVAPVQNIKNRVVRGPVPTLTLVNSRIKNNKFGIYAAYYNRYLDELGNHFLRKSNESINVINCDISHNTESAISVVSPYWDVFVSNVSEITIMVNSSLITDNGQGIHQFSRDLRGSNNLFHWILQSDTVERNAVGGFDVSLPYVWQYNENFTHSLFFANNTFHNNKNFAFIVGGHFAKVNMSSNVFDGNQCKTGLVLFSGMEKELQVDGNRMENNAGQFMVEFRADSQSEILGTVHARFELNIVKGNRFGLPSFNRGFLQVTSPPTYVIGFNGIQKVVIYRNRLGNNGMDYELVAGVRTAKINNAINVKENWWGSADVTEIKKRIFDFDDWNNHAMADFRPYLTEDTFESSVSVSFEQPSPIDLDNLGGRLQESLTLYERGQPYVVKADITVMPEVTLSIAAGVVMEFAPNVGILVLGTLRAQGRRGQEIVMKPVETRANMEDNVVVKRQVREPLLSESVRLCTWRNCTSTPQDQEFGSLANNEGFLEYFNRTTLQWVPICDERFTERNAQVVCRELGFSTLSVFFDYGPRVEFHQNSLTRIWSWPEPLQCVGDETKFEDCKVRLNGQRYGHREECPWNGDFVFIHCGETNVDHPFQFWGGIRFAHGQFEQSLYESRVHDTVTHQTTGRADSVLEWLNLTGAGVLHNEKSPAILGVSQSPAVSSVNVSRCASHGIALVSPVDHARLLFNRVEHSLGVGVLAVLLTGEGREAGESSFAPLRGLMLPYHVFSMMDACDPAKVVTVEERVLLYFKYDSNPVNCVKIFKSTYNSKPFGFRLLQFNLFNSTGKPGRPDSITIYDGDIYNVTARVIGSIEVGNSVEKKFFRTNLPSMSVRLFANGASSVHGFIAEIVTLPISAIGFNRDVQHNISYSVLSNNREGAVSYSSAGEVNPAVTLEWNQFTRNCAKLYGNFSTCKAAVDMDVQNTQNIYFRNNYVRHNQGGLAVKADSRGSATSLKGWVHNNLFADNGPHPALSLEGRHSSPYQEVTVYRNYFAHNHAPFANVIALKQVVSNFTYNYVHDNRGQYILEVSGFEKVRLPIYQTTSHNGFYKNYALDRQSRGTIIAGTAGQQYVDNVFFNPDNDYEIVTVNRCLSHDVWKSRIDAAHNWWGYNETLSVSSRIRDRLDSRELLEIDFEPFHMNNRSVLSGKCPPGWGEVGDTCYIYVGAPASFDQARAFCRSVNASMPYVMGNYLSLFEFLRGQQRGFQFYDRVWVQNIDLINRCTVFVYQTIEVDHCQRLNPFLCEIDPKVLIDPLSWRDDVVTVAVLGSVGAALVVVAVVAGFWYRKSRHRHAERLQRRSSIRQSLHSIRSVGLASSQAGFSDLSLRRKLPPASNRSSPTLTKTSDYKKMNGSMDSMDKSQFNSSVEDNRSYDIYEAHNPNASAATFNFASDLTPTPSSEAASPGFNLAYRNAGFRDTSTLASREDWTQSAYDEPAEDYLASSATLPLDATFRPSKYHEPRPPPLELPLLPPEPPEPYYPSSANLLETDVDDPAERPRSEMLLETNLDEGLPSKPARSKSEVLLETSLDAFAAPTETVPFHRSKSQPLETSM